MSDATRAETAELSPLDALWQAKRVKFERLHRDYLAAQAAYADPDGPEDDEHRHALADKQDEAELALLMTPAPLAEYIWTKWEILDRFATIDADAGQHVENRVITALGAIKADILRFGLKDPG